MTRGVACDNDYASHPSTALQFTCAVVRPSVGQPSDKGSMVSYCSAGSGDEAKAFKVVFVRKAVDNDQVIEHIGDFCGPADWQGFLPGQQVLLKVDEVVRLVNARLHSAGHAIDAAMQRCGIFSQLKATKGYHFSDGPYVEYQGSISEAQLATLPVDLNNEMQRIIRESIPTTVELMDNASAGSVCGCDTSSYPPRVRVVSLAGVSIPCGGTDRCCCCCYCCIPCLMTLIA